MSNTTAVIIIDTGFSRAALQSARRILAAIDVASCRVESCADDTSSLTWARNADILGRIAQDDLNHGTLVLNSLLAVNPDIPVILVRAYDSDVKLIRTEFAGGEMVRPGWTEAYRAAVDICRKRGMTSVANLSFGGYTHAMDGSGWESHVLAHDCGAGKPGHIILAGAGTGDGTAIHASWKTTPGSTEEVSAFQTSPTTYNFWSAADADAPEANDWLLEVFLNDFKIGQELSSHVGPNLWNNRKQVTIQVPGAGKVVFRTSRFFRSDAGFGGIAAAHSSQGARRLSNVGHPLERSPDQAHLAVEPTNPLVTSAPQLDPLRFDCWINQSDSRAMFLDHKDVMSIAEPAIFSHVIAVGLSSGEYAEDQNELGAKPDLLIEGPGPISFRLPEVAARVAAMLGHDPSLDVVAVRKLLGKRKDA